MRALEPGILRIVNVNDYKWLSYCCDLDSCHDGIDGLVGLMCGIIMMCLSYSLIVKHVAECFFFLDIHFWMIVLVVAY